MRAVITGTWWLRRITAGCLIGILSATVTPAPPSFLGNPVAYAAASQSRAHSGCSLTQRPQAGIAPVVSSNSSLYGAQSNISVNPAKLGLGYVNCADNAYWVGFQTNVSSGCGGVGLFGPDGWVAVYNSSNNTVTYKYFDEYYDAAQFVGCGDHELYLGSAATGTYEVSFQ